MELSELRERMDQINRDIVLLFTERMELSRQIAESKASQGLPVLDRERERAVLREVSSLAGQQHSARTRTLFTTLFDLSKAYQRETIQGESELEKELSRAKESTPAVFPTSGSIACQGAEGAYSQLAADRLFPGGDIMFFSRFEGVFRAVSKGLCDYGVLPIENSTYGSVGEVYDLLRKHGLYIVRAERLHVAHSLLGKKGARLEDIETVYSHEQALGQCSDFLAEHARIKANSCENTAVAARIAAEDKSGHTAAIASGACAELYGLERLLDDVQDSENNYTRFICVAKQAQIFPGANRISLMLTTEHRAGALYEVIAQFAALGINLTKLESRPIPGKDFEFRFFFDLSASIETPGVLKLLGSLSDGSGLRFMGCYSEV